MISKEDFMKVWKDTSRENILNQFYHDYKTLREEYEKWNELKKWLEEESKLKGSETAYLYYGRVLKQMQELEKKQ